MSTIITFKCDRCGKSEGGLQPPPWISTVTLLIDRGVRTGQHYHQMPISPARREHWCNDCLVNLGIRPLSFDDPPAMAPEEPATLEDLIRELVADEVANHEH